MLRVSPDVSHRRRNELSLIPNDRFWERRADERAGGDIDVDFVSTADGCGARAWAAMPTIRQLEVPCAYSLPPSSSIRPSTVITVRPRESTVPITRKVRPSGRIGRTNVIEVSWDGQISPGLRVVSADNPIAKSSIVIAQPP